MKYFVFILFATTFIIIYRKRIQDKAQDKHESPEPAVKGPRNQTGLVAALGGLFSIVIFVLQINFLPDLLKVIAGNPKLFYENLTGGRKYFHHNLSRFLKRESKGVPNVYVVGGSSARELFWPDGIMRKELGMGVVSLGSPLQDITDSIRLVDNISTKGSIVVYVYNEIKFIEDNRKRFYKSLDRTGVVYPLLLYSDQLDIIYEKYNPAFNFDNRRTDKEQRYVSLLTPYAILVRDILSGKQEDSETSGKNILQHNRDVYKTNQWSAADHKDFLKKKFSNKAEGEIEKSLKYNYTMLEELAELCIRKEIQLIIVDLPKPTIYPISYDFMQKFYEKYDHHRSVSHIRLTEAQIGNRYLYYGDENHLNDKGREKYLPFIIAAIKKEMENNPF